MSATPAPAACRCIYCGSFLIRREGLLRCPGGCDALGI